jgi:hypothetical protein
MKSIAVLLLTAALLACSRAPSAEGDSYFPLQAGHRWVYDMKLERENNTVSHETMAFTTHGSQTVGDKPAWRRRSDSGVEYWLRADDSGIYRVASKSDLDAEPLPDKEPRYVLKTPLQTGSEWRASTTAYILERRQEFPREIRHNHAPVAMTYTLEALGEKVATRAGSFTDCLRVQGRAQMRLYADPVVGWRDIPLLTTEWYCKGVGLVKLQRVEQAASTFLSGGTLTMELLEWH